MTIHTIHDYRDRDQSQSQNRSQSQRQDIYKNIIKFINEYKITSGLCFLMIIICAIVNIYPIYIRRLFGIDIVLRGIVSSFVHVQPAHLIVNLIALISFHNVEKDEGITYLYKIFYFVFMNACLKESLNRFYTVGFSVGYSGVLFAFATLYPRNNFFGHQIDKIYYPFVMLLFAYISNENSSFIGHLVGIVSAYIYIFVINIRD
jgi:membrane associated rhomboid family serine protease